MKIDFISQKESDFVKKTFFLSKMKDSMNKLEGFGE